MKNRSIILPAVILGIAIPGSGLFAEDAPTAGLALVLLLLCVWPAVAWVRSGMRHLPLFEVYSLMHLIYYWLPAGKDGGEILDLGQEQRMVVLGALCVYLSCGQAAYFGILRKLRRQRAHGWRIWNDEVPAMKGTRLPWVMVSFWLLFGTVFQNGFIWSLVPGSAISLIRALCGAAGMLGIFVLAHKSGEGKLSGFQAALFVVVMIAGTLISFASGYLGVGTLFVGNAFFAYMVGARRLPILSLTLFLLLVSFLNYGKGEMRIRYWAMGESTDDIVELYSHWFKSSWEQLALPLDRREDSISALERANLTWVFVQVVTQTPGRVPYLQGKTYLDSLQLFIPRIIWPDRPSLHIIMNEVGLHYGIHTSVESTESTMISIGQAGEAWANGGWLVVALVGAFFGLFFSVGVRVAYRRGYSTVGFLFGMTFVGFAANLEHLTGTLLMTFYQTAIATLILLYWLSQRSVHPPAPVRSFEREASGAEAGKPMVPLRVDELSPHCGSEPRV